MAEESVKRGEHYKSLQTTPLKKIASVTEVANTIVSVVSKKVSGHTNGNNIFVHGGMEGRVLNSIDDLKNS